MQPKKYENPKIALLNVELELKAEKENAEIRVDNVQVSVLLIFKL
jgi:T-complex protein 1 subunit eta